MDGMSFALLRKSLGLTQADMGEAIGYSRQAIIKWEKGLAKLPIDIEQKLRAANLALAQPRGKPVTEKTHRELYRGSFRTLAHPKWWCGVASPFQQLCSEDEWRSIDAIATTTDLLAYQPPTADQARVIMIRRGISPERAEKYLKTMGAIETTESSWVIYWRDNPGGSVREFEALYPGFTSHRDTAPAAPVNPPDLALHDALNTTFATLNPNQEK